MKQTFSFTAIITLVFFLTGCCDESAQDYIIVESIVVNIFDEDYFEDDLDEGFPELYAIVRINGDNDFTSEVSYSQALPAFIDFESFHFIGEEMNIQVEILIYDDDEATTEDFIGSTTFVPSDFLLQRNRRETVQGGFLELDLILKWECDS
ncbi:MAG: C2 domain-containing protein [Bacteroidetes bacterium]|jgi:hypothetical protein|nr:C2 domain-containing protein [Bacteroidota bacterium]